MALLEVRNLRVEFLMKKERLMAVEGLSFELNPGEILGIVGESGSGKTVTALSVLRLLPRSAKVTGSILYGGKDILKSSRQELEELRGKEISMIFQDPTSSLNPLMTVKQQIDETIRWYQKLPKDARQAKVRGLLEKVNIPDPTIRMGQYPHEMSGGMNQRIMIAMMALALQPKILIADEPTTALDVTIQAQILGLIRDLARDSGLSVILITHNLGLVAEYADRVLIMKDGCEVERGSIFDVFQNPQNAYTRNLLEVVPRIDKPTKKKSGVRGQDDILKVHDLKVYFPIFSQGVFRSKVADVKAVDDISFQVSRGETLGVVGESGCGKTTLARAILGLVPLTSGRIVFKGQSAQMVFQDASIALNPRRSVGDSVIEGLEIHGLLKPNEREKKAQELFDLVHLDGGTLGRFPLEFSSGQRQRIGIARALALNPDLLILDEPVASLDVSVQAQIISLLLGIKDKFNLTYLIISHDLALINLMADRVMVMYLGKIMESMLTQKLLDNSLHPYTQALLSSIPIPNPLLRGRKKIMLEGDIPSPLNPPQGCVFKTRCPFREDICSTEPKVRQMALEHFVACHKAA